MILSDTKRRVICAGVGSILGLLTSVIFLIVYYAVVSPSLPDDVRIKSAIILTAIIVGVPALTFYAVLFRKPILEVLTRSEENP